MEIILNLIKNNLSPCFYIIVTISICSSIVGVILLIINKIFKNKLSFKYKKIIWIIFFISLLIMPKIENKFSIYNFINIEKIEELSININFNSLDTYKYLNKNENYEFDDFKIKIVDQTDKLEFKEIISIIYFCILIIKILRIIIIKIYYKTNSKIIDNNCFEIKIIKNIKDKLNIKKDIILIKSKAVSSPMIGGIIKPKIFIGDKKINEIDLECMLTHELCHYKRKDNIVNLFINIFRIVYFFNPITKHILNKIENELELATDEMTLNILDKNNTNRYCNLLVFESNKKNIEKYNLGFAKQKSFIEQRINNIIAKQNVNVKRKYVVILFLLIILIIFFCFTKQKNTITESHLKYITININNIEYKIEKYNKNKEYKIIKCKSEDILKLKGNKNLYSLNLNKQNLKSKIESNSTIFFNNSDININSGVFAGKFLYEMKIKYETKEEILYCFILEIE